MKEFANASSRIKVHGSSMLKSYKDIKQLYYWEKVNWNKRATTLFLQDNQNF